MSQEPPAEKAGHSEQGLFFFSGCLQLFENRERRAVVVRPARAGRLVEIGATSGTKAPALFRTEIFHGKRQIELLSEQIVEINDRLVKQDTVQITAAALQLLQAQGFVRPVFEQYLHRRFHGETVLGETSVTDQDKARPQAAPQFHLVIVLASQGAHGSDRPVEPEVPLFFEPRNSPQFKTTAVRGNFAEVDPHGRPTPVKK